MAHIYLSATQKSSGKTTVSVGLAAELRRRGLRVQPFKKGPDYIDPMWLARASGRSCLNLDYHTTGEGEIVDGFARWLEDADIGLVEGNVGLFDSVDLGGAHSNAELAKLLRAPVVLVIDVEGMARGLAPLLLGYLAFDPDLAIAGVILNKTGGSRHEGNLRRVVEHYTPLPVLGALPRGGAVGISERHLGLIPANEADDADGHIDRIRAAVADHVDVDAIVELASRQVARVPCAPMPNPAAPGRADVRIGVARDDAFGFYYADDLLALEQGGAELVPFSPVRDDALPDVDGLLLGGGFPESRMRELQDNQRMRASIAAFLGDGGPAYAECGGLMYLCRRLHWSHRSAEMCGVLDADVAMHERPQGRGYVRLRETDAFPWPSDGAVRSEINAHEFHHSALIDPPAHWTYAYDVLRGTGIDGRHDGMIKDNLLASYAHLRDVGGLGWTRRFLAHVRRCRR